MKQRSIKQRLFLLAGIVICAALSAHGSVAYFTAEDTATNVITTGTVRIELVETMLPEQGGEPVPFEDQMDVMPGCEVSKIVEVKNTGSQPAYVRLRVTKEIKLSGQSEGEADLSLVTFDLNSQDWEERDGFYYYREPLQPGQTTQPLFTAVSFSESMGNLYQDSIAVVQVKAYATQTANNGETVFDAAGWPEAE